MSENNWNINIAVLGKSGVGKSSFCNYMFGTKIFESGKGAPVTHWRNNFQRHTLDYNGLSLQLFDSVGIEPDNYKRWLDEFEKFKAESSADTLNPKEWLHGIFYLINANSARVEPVDEQVIKSAINAQMPFQLILTNADTASQEKVADLRNTLQGKFNQIKITEVCSCSIRKRNGQHVQSFGADDVKKAFVTDIESYLGLQINIVICHRAKENIRKVFDKLEDKIKKSDLSIISLIKKAINNELDGYDPFDLESINVDDFKYYQNFHAAFGLPDTSDDVQEKIADIMNNVMNRQADKFDGAINEIEDGFRSNVIDKVKAAGKVAAFGLRVKSRISKLIQETADISMSEIDSLARNYQHQRQKAGYPSNPFISAFASAMPVSLNGKFFNSR